MPDSIGPGDDIALPTPKLIARKQGAIGWIVINSPARRNAVSFDMWASIPLALDAMESDDAIRAIVLTGAGDKSFASGADITEFDAIRNDAPAQERWDRTAETARQRLAATPKPLIAMIRGFCLGGGIQIAINADIRIASDDAQFGIPAANLGSAYHADSVSRLNAVMGPAATLDMLLSGRRFGAAEALAIGLINRAVPGASLLQAVRDYAGLIAANSPLSTRSMKTIVLEVQKPPSERDDALMEHLVKHCHLSADNAEGRRAFKEKRQPVFTGQ